ncbi:hypothetical protein acsn021_02330 [Anaerocolumna cellulosilytica]|uniref:Uncharacterized protein n=1 Tax=Anaerocolumna cellulosilytica TaxID=433286 RepID=A0A6S6QQ15_9FIRM|nr:S1C family serine protease [Anaerocolumna cellulosilytica]MBB5196936.1 S1-C subfamily serine protease [Anaerocolumna cellulosilytica]BCJ92664.1 hypothetical protein acsn021_02330 [Anaerocolumna cellulosilytica]
MSEDNNGKDGKVYSFIQEQVTSKKKFKIKRMLYSAAWTIILACIFGLVAGVVFCISGPAINRLLGKNEDKKTVEFPTITPEDNNNTNPNGNSGTGGSEEEDSDGKNDGETETEPKTETVIIEKYINADIKDLISISQDLRNLVSKAEASVVKVIAISNSKDVFNNDYESAGMTTGLVVADNGEDLLVLVSYDKVKDAADIRVNVHDSLQVKAKLQDYDVDLNLAIIALSLVEIPESVKDSIQIANLGESYTLSSGMFIVALGSPNGYVGSMEVGIVTSKGLSLPVTDNRIDVFQTDINYNENSDGFIINLKGEVIGLITNKLKDEYNGQVNTAIGISKIKKIIEDMANQKDRSYFGIKGTDMTEAALLEAGIENGICITEVEADSPALAAGLQSGDMILTVNDIPIISMSSFYNQLSSSVPKSKIKITIQRIVKSELKMLEVEVTLSKKVN